MIKRKTVLTKSTSIPGVRTDGLELRIARVYIPRRQYVERLARESEKYDPTDWDSLSIEVRSIHQVKIRIISLFYNSQLLRN